MPPHQLLDDDAFNSDDSSSKNLAFDINEDGVLDADTNTTEINPLEDIHVDEGQIGPNISTTREWFGLSEPWKRVVLYHVVSLGARPQDILQLRFREIQIVLARRPDGEHELLIQFAPESTKGTSPKMSKPVFRLGLSTILLDTLLLHRAFRASDLVSAAQLKNLDIPSDKQELLLPLREDLDDKPLFRWANDASAPPWMPDGMSEEPASGWRRWMEMVRRAN